MQCSSCGTTLPAGASFCTNCGAPITNKASGQGSPGAQPNESPQVKPTVLASSSYGATQLAQPPNQPVVPPTAYGAPSYRSTPQEYSYDAPPPPPNIYSASQSQSPDLYGTPPPPPNTYRASPPPYNPYGAPYAPSPGSFVPLNQPSTSRPGPRIGLIISIVVLLLLVVGGAIIALRAANSSSQGNNTATVTTAPTSSPTTSTSPAVTPTTQSVSPSGTPIDPTAAVIVTNAQTASAIDNNYLPIKLTSNFAVGQTVYVTFRLSQNGQLGYVEAKLYGDNTYIGDKILTVQANFDHGYFDASPNKAANGAVELYWCTQFDCSDAKLATFVTFKVS